MYNDTSKPVSGVASSPRRAHIRARNGTSYHCIPLRTTKAVLRPCGPWTFGCRAALWAVAQPSADSPLRKMRKCCSLWRLGSKTGNILRSCGDAWVALYLCPNARRFAREPLVWARKLPCELADLGAAATRARQLSAPGTVLTCTGWMR